MYLKEEMSNPKSTADSTNSSPTKLYSKKSRQAIAVKRVIAGQIEQEMALQKLTKTAMAAPLEPPSSRRYSVRLIALLAQPSMGADRPR